jgi:hypothetical protein
MRIRRILCVLFVMYTVSIAVHAQQPQCVTYNNGHVWCQQGATIPGKFCSTLANGHVWCLESRQQTPVAQPPQAVYIPRPVCPAGTYWGYTDPYGRPICYLVYPAQSAYYPPPYYGYYYPRGPVIYFRFGWGQPSFGIGHRRR